MNASHCKYFLEFKRPSGTSRGILTKKETHFIILEENNKKGIGECGLLRGLSIDDVPGYEDKIFEICDKIHLGLPALLRELKEYPSIQFGLEQAFLSLNSADPFTLFPSSFTKSGSPIPINGLIWMGGEEFLYEQLDSKIEQGFTCIKLKVGALDFMKECRFLEALRNKYPPDKIELRLDANGAFNATEAMDKLQRLSKFYIHSIEQPIAKGQFESMSELCKNSPIPIALDEELIGIFDKTEKLNLLKTIDPAYIILKPSLVGGFRGSLEWINMADELGIGWWITSALESNIGLNAIAQWTFTLGSKMFQGLGTGSLYLNNFDTPLQVMGGNLYYDSSLKWPANLIQNLCS